MCKFNLFGVQFKEKQLIDVSKQLRFAISHFPNVTSNCHFISYPA